MYAVVKTGGKQVKVAQGDVLRIEKLDVPVGDTIELADIAMLVKDDKIVVEAKKLKKAKVICEVLAQDRAKKIRVFKKKRRQGYVRTYGHRQSFTQIKVIEIKS